MTLGFSPEQTDSLLAAWRERQRQDAFSEFFKQYILEDSTEVADSTPDSVYSRRGCSTSRRRSSSPTTAS